MLEIPTCSVGEVIASSIHPNNTSIPGYTPQDWLSWQVYNAGCGTTFDTLGTKTLIFSFCVVEPGPRCHTNVNGFSAGSFDGVLLDAPCTALGLRPRLLHRQTIGDLISTASYQRKLLDVAVQLVKPGGTLVYSTCTINPGNTAPIICCRVLRFGHCCR